MYICTLLVYDGYIRTGKQLTRKDVVNVRVIQIVDLRGHIRFDEFKEYPGMSTRDAFMLYVMSADCDETNTQSIQLLEDGVVIEHLSIVV